MRNKLMYAGVTHETAQVGERIYLALDQSEKDELTQILTQKFELKALIIITTCNRTEVYFESKSASAFEVREILIAYINKLHSVEISRESFLMLDNSIDTAHHLLQVANGLRSAVIGDKQIISQVKKAYLQALERKNQGSLLERAFQAVFKSHKRIYRESLYQQGSTSTAYSSLKLVEDYIGKAEIQNLSLLIIGAGEIAEDLLKYLPKFHFGQKYIANRTAAKATQLAQRYDIQTYDWEWVISNDFSSFDVIITAVSQRKHLVKSINEDHKKRLWIDLAMPSNIDVSIANQSNQVYNIDDVTSLVSTTNEAQLKAVPIVEEIIKEELNIFVEWLEGNRNRAILNSYKQRAKQISLSSIPEETRMVLSISELEDHTEMLANRMVREFLKTLNNSINGRTTFNEMEIKHQVFG